MRIFTVASAVLVAGGIALACLTPAQTGVAQVQTIEVAKQEWATTRYKQYGNWESICETRTHEFGIQPVNLAGPTQERCYIRYIDVFNPMEAPDTQDGGATIAAFVSSDGKGLKVDFGLDGSMPFQTIGVQLSREGKSVWSIEDDCLNRGVCSFTGPAAEALVRVFSDQTADALEMQINFTNLDGRTGVRNWPMMPFGQAFEDYQRNILQ
tara:strand:- start:18114 stop:18743 length:630 start_codon:yes stop_codon:yes gene_type:complete